MEKQSRKTKILSGLVTLLLILSIGLCMFVFAQVSNRGYVSIFGYSFFRVSTGSMEPSIPIGAIILTHKTDIEDIQIDDVVSFYSKETYMQGSIITHRVVDRDTGADGKVRLTTRGDANSAADIYYVDGDNLIGKLVWNSAGDNPVAKAIAFLSGRVGFFTCIALPIILVAVSIFRKSMRTMLEEIKNIQQQMQEIPEKGSAEEQTTTQTEEVITDPDISKTEYAEMYERIRTELIKELEAKNGRESSEKE